MYTKVIKYYNFFVENNYFTEAETCTFHAPFDQLFPLNSIGKRDQSRKNDGPIHRLTRRPYTLFICFDRISCSNQTAHFRDRSGFH